MEQLLYGQLTASNTVRDQKTPYTIYEIEVRSSSTVKWVIYRRYSDFFALHTELLKIAASSNDELFRLPYLPPKRLTRSLAVDFVEKRKLELQAYLSELLRSRQLICLPAVMQFLTIPDSVRPMIIRQSGPYLSSDEAASAPVEAPATSSAKRGGMTTTFEERKVKDFIMQLNTAPNKVCIIREFQHYFFVQRPRLSSELINTLLEGTSIKDGGLIWVCGDLSYSLVASKAALGFICKLLDVEKNKDAQQFLEVVSTFDMSVIGKLNLHRHILHDRAGPAFQLAYILSQTIPHWSLEKCLVDVTARQEFQRWVQRKQIIAERHGFFADHQREHNDDLPVFTTQYCNSLCNAALGRIQQSASSDQGWRNVHGPIRSSAATIQIVHKQLSDGIYMVRLASALAAEPAAVFKMLRNEERRKEWDLLIHKSTVVQKIDDLTDIVNESYIGDVSDRKLLNFVMVRSCRTEPDGSYAIIKCSVPPANKTSTKAALTSGYLITPVVHGDDYRSTLLLWVAQFDRDSVRLVISDLLGDSDKLLKSFQRLGQY